MTDPKRVIRETGSPIRFGLNVLALLLMLFPLEGYSLSRESAGLDARVDVVTSRHTIKIRGKLLAYTARAGFIPLQDATTGAVQAQIFFVSYTVPPRRGAPARPLTFYTTGGPVEPATLAAIGPRILKGMTSEGLLPAPPYSMVDNPKTWLSTTDLVLIDPVGTGYSHSTQSEYTSGFYNAGGDARSLAQFIQRYLEQYDPDELQPLFVAGFSYGSQRSALIAAMLSQHGLSLRGLMLFSSTLANVPRHIPDPLRDASFAQLLPSYTAAAFAHKRLPQDLQGNLDEALRQAEAWATADYPQLLANDSELSANSDGLSNEKLRAAAATMARLTGLSPEVILYNRFRFAPDFFLRNLFGAQWTGAALFDSRQNAGDSAEFGLPPEWYNVLSGVYLRDEQVIIRLQSFRQTSSDSFRKCL